MLNYIFAIGSLLVAVICLFLSKNTPYYGSIEKKYGEAAARRMAKSLKIWGYFFIVASGIMILALLFEGSR